MLSLAVSSDVEEERDSVIVSKSKCTTVTTLAECKSFDCREVKLPAILKPLSKHARPLTMFPAACQPSPSRSTIATNTAFMYGSESDVELEASLSIRCQASPSAMLMGTDSEDGADGIEDALDFDLDTLPHMPCLTPPPLAPAFEDCDDDDEDGEAFDLYEHFSSFLDDNDDDDEEHDDFEDSAQGPLCAPEMAALSIQIPTLPTPQDHGAHSDIECGPNVSERRFQWQIGCAENRAYPMSAFLRSRLETMTDDEEECAGC